MTITEPARTETGALVALGTVQIQHITKRFGDNEVVKDLSLTVDAGEFISLLGPSGCGKTTMLRMIAGFEDPNEGDILINGQSVVGRPPYRRPVNTVFQQYALFPHMTVAENVAFGLRRSGVQRGAIGGRVAEALDMVRMRAFADRSPSALSGGQQQRVALARALVNRPAVLLLDEPLSALDRQLREEMQVELKLLQSRLGTTFVFVTHDQGEALSMSDRIAVMNAGRIEQLGDATEIYSHPASAYVASFIGQQNFFDGVLGADGTVVAGSITARAADPGALVAGDAVRAAVRPEVVTLRAGATDGIENSTPGTVVGVSHLGDTMQFLVDADGYTLLIKMPRPSAPTLSVGDAVTCSWDAAEVQVFAAPADDVPTATPSIVGSTEAASEKAPSDGV